MIQVKFNLRILNFNKNVTKVYLYLMKLIEKSKIQYKIY